jgi:RND family efflux transporter MFP subunit
MTNRNLGLAFVWVRRTQTAADSAVADADLLARFLATGDAAAFASLVGRHQRLVLGVCMRVLHDTHDAEDAFQTAFLVLARKARTIARRENLAAWLYKVAYRCALTTRAARARRSGRERSLAVGDDIVAPTEDASPAERRELSAIVDEELRRLPERFRTPTILCYLAGKTVDETAAQLGCPRGTVASRLARARERLRCRLAKRGVVLPASLTALAFTSALSADAAPRALIGSTIHVIKLQAAGGAIFAPAALLAERVLRAMLLRKLLIGAAVLAVFTMIAVTGGLLSRPVDAQPADPQHPEAKKARSDKTALPVGELGKRAVAPAFEDFLGRLESSQQIDIGARVAGQLNSVRVKEGADVKKGDLLFEIDDREARVEVERAVAELARSEFAFKATTANLERAQTLMKSAIISREELDKHTRDAAVAAATIKVARAALARANLTLDSHRVRAPIAGRIARIFVDAGALIQANGAKPLASLVVVDPIAVRFNIGERTFLRYQKLKDKAIEVRFAILAADETGYPHQATLTTVRQSVDPATATVLVSAAAANPNCLLLPGMAVRVRLNFAPK